MPRLLNAGYHAGPFEYLNDIRAGDPGASGITRTPWIA